MRDSGAVQEPEPFLREVGVSPTRGNRDLQEHVMGEEGGLGWGVGGWGEEGLGD